VGSNPNGGMDVLSVVSVVCLCDELITLPEESYRLGCVVVCDLENFKNEEAMTRVGSQHHSKKRLQTVSCSRLLYWVVVFVLVRCWFPTL